MTAHLNLEPSGADQQSSALQSSAIMSQSQTNNTVVLEGSYIQRHRIYHQVQDIAEKYDICHTTV